MHWEGIWVPIENFCSLNMNHFALKAMFTGDLSTHMNLVSVHYAHNLSGNNLLHIIEETKLG